MSSCTQTLALAAVCVQATVCSSSCRKMQRLDGKACVDRTDAKDSETPRGKPQVSANVSRGGTVFRLVQAWGLVAFSWMTC